MTPRNRPGTCLICRAVISKKLGLQHGEKCIQSSGWPIGSSPSFIIKIEDRHDPTYWLMILAQHDARLNDIDSLIRDVWVECCNHLSAFTIGKETYMHTDEEMNIPLADLIKKGSLFYYEYDFESTTELRLKVVGVTPVMPPEGRICLTARNNHPSYPCSICGKKADFYVSNSEEEEAGQYCCLDCTLHLDGVYVQLIENSPRTGICCYSENPDVAINWYPPGWTVDDFQSKEIQKFMEYLRKNQETDGTTPDNCQCDDEMVDDMVSAVSADIGDEITAFIKEEQASHDGEAIALAEEIVTTFSTMLYGYHKKKIGEWDAPLIHTTLLNDVAQNPSLPDDWLDNTVPILCRFLAYMEKYGRLQNAAALITELQETEPLFRETVIGYRGAGNQSGSIMEQERTNETEGDEFAAKGTHTAQESIPMAQTTPDSEEENIISESLSGNSQNASGEEASRHQMIFDQCVDFCNRLENEGITKRCREIVTNMTTHPEDPLSRGGSTLWSAAIVYMVCKDEGLIGRATGGCPLAQDICEYYDLKLTSVRSKVSVLNKRLAECTE
ncbi:DUF6398 domain-containing protein [Methanogenium marinum]|uniref:DUF6398 domain-containing protein n=1 Tax=Methanogenium marinum TaxID=348610 RepID=A0A9Q4KNL6_9EURY|nr:DUF6398 domain-containing protein [Methanogenium marinum]MDE4907340.1 DUF6398 domain-containing protein [Methanogenium marinum]